MTVTIRHGDCREVLQTLPDQSVHCCVTSPPYFGLRDYGHAGQIGLEPSPEEFVAEMVAVFRDVRRVLRNDGTLWLNLGDSYTPVNRGENARPRRETMSGIQVGNPHADIPTRKDVIQAVARSGMKQKDLMGIPWRVAFALQADGWYLRQDIIWSKPNPMPESVTDRCTKAHEYIFLMSKSARYFYDAKVIAEKSIGANTHGSNATAIPGRNDQGGDLARVWGGETRNRRSVWEVTTSPYAEAHFATFPPNLIEPCIKAGCPEKACAECGAPWRRDVEKTTTFQGGSGAAGRTAEEVNASGKWAGKQYGTNLKLGPVVSTRTVGFSPSCSCDAEAVGGTVLDPFGGAGTTGLVADRLGRDAILIELNKDYAEMAQRRIEGDAGMFAEVSAVTSQERD